MNDALSICRNQVMAFFRHLDDRNYDALVKVLTADGEWHRQGRILKGREAVHEALSKRPATLRIHHLISNLVADRIDDQQCVMRAYMLVVRHDDGSEIKGPAPLAGIENIRTTHITLARAGDTWSISLMSNDDPSFAVPA